MKRRSTVLGLLACAGAVLALVFAPGCTSPIANRAPLGEVFPQSVGRSLTKEEVEVPDAWLGAPTVVLIGYVQEAQFDADRWLLGLLQSQIVVRIVELPTIPSRIASVFGGTIDEGMRSGIPPEDWSSVVTIYGAAAEPIARFTGTEKPRNMRVLLLDAEGRVVWYHDAGYSARELLELAAVLDGLRADGATAPTLEPRRP